MLFGDQFDPYDAKSYNKPGLFGPGGMLGGTSGGAGGTPDVLGRAQQGGYVQGVPEGAQLALHGAYGGGPNDSSIERFGRVNNDPNSPGNWNWSSMFNREGPQGQPSPMTSAGTRTFQGYGGREGFGGNPVEPYDTGLFKGATGISGYYNADPYMSPGRSMEDLDPYSQQRANDPYLQNPGQAASDVYGIRGQLSGLGLDPNDMAQRGVSDITGLSNKYTDQLMRSIDEEANRSLGVQLPEAQAKMQAMGLSDSGPATRIGGDVASDIMKDANRRKIEALTGLTESNLGRQAQAIGQRTGVGAQAGEQAFGEAAGAYGSALGQRAQGLGQIYGTQGDLLKQAQADRQATLRQQQDLMQRALGGADQSVMQRLGMESQEQSRGLADYQGLWNSAQADRQGKLQEMLGLSDYERSIQQEGLNQQLQYGMLPLNLLMQMISGIQTGGAPNQPRTTPWWQSAGQSLLGGYAGGLGQQAAASGRAPADWSDPRF